MSRFYRRRLVTAWTFLPNYARELIVVVVTIIALSPVMVAYLHAADESSPGEMASLRLQISKMMKQKADETAPRRP